MCFSAPASYIASGGLAIVGVDSLRRANKKQKMFAAIPVLFAIQQFFEGYQWTSLVSGSMSDMSAYVFIFFALLFWPIYLPITVFVLDEKRRNVLRWMIIFGIILVAYFLNFVFISPLEARIVSNSIQYNTDNLFGIFSTIPYLIIVCGSFLLSSKDPLRWFGVALLTSAVGSEILYLNTFTSVWCYFSALLSSIIYFYIRYNKIN
jgi:hypothetical protein